MVAVVVVFFFVAWISARFFCFFVPNPLSPSPPQVVFISNLCLYYCCYFHTLLLCTMWRRIVRQWTSAMFDKRRTFESGCEGRGGRECRAGAKLLERRHG